MGNETNYWFFTAPYACEYVNVTCDAVSPHIAEEEGRTDFGYECHMKIFPDISPEIGPYN